MTIIPTALLTIIEYSVYIILCKPEENLFVICCILCAAEATFAQY
jgi:hypothetical protein